MGVPQRPRPLLHMSALHAPGAHLLHRPAAHALQAFRSAHRHACLCMSVAMPPSHHAGTLPSARCARSDTLPNAWHTHPDTRQPGAHHACLRTARVYAPRVSTHRTCLRTTRVYALRVSTHCACLRTTRVYTPCMSVPCLVHAGQAGAERQGSGTAGAFLPCGAVRWEDPQGILEAAAALLCAPTSSNGDERAPVCAPAPATAARPLMAQAQPLRALCVHYPERLRHFFLEQLQPRPCVPAPQRLQEGGGQQDKQQLLLPVAAAPSVADYCKVLDAAAMFPPGTPGATALVGLVVCMRVNLGGGRG